jgi:mannose-6-phosphate isomerase-like protein (cupin superfamily)
MERVIQPVGRYEVLADYETTSASVRVIRMTEGGEVQRHLHQLSGQVYLVLDGFVIVDVDGQESDLGPYGCVEVPAGSVHSARPSSPTAVVVNISVPALSASDQVPVPASGAEESAGPI